MSFFSWCLSSRWKLVNFNGQHEERSFLPSEKKRPFCRTVCMKMSYFLTQSTYKKNSFLFSSSTKRNIKKQHLICCFVPHTVHIKKAMPLKKVKKVKLQKSQFFPSSVFCVNGKYYVFTKKNKKKLAVILSFHYWKWEENTKSRYNRRGTFLPISWRVKKKFQIDLSQRIFNIF